jgi:hypothetical protein
VSSEINQELYIRQVSHFSGIRGISRCALDAICQTHSATSSFPAPYPYPSNPSRHRQAHLIPNTIPRTKKPSCHYPSQINSHPFLRKPSAINRDPCTHNHTHTAYFIHLQCAACCAQTLFPLPPPRLPVTSTLSYSHHKGP